MTQIKQENLDWCMPVKTFKWPGIQIPIDLNQRAIAQLFNSLSLGNKSSQNSVTVLITTAFMW